MYTTPAAIAGDIYVQKVTIYWSKAARGMPEADVRSKLPLAFALDAADMMRLAVEDTYSSIVMLGQNGFMPQQTVTAHGAYRDKLDWGTVAVKFPNNRAGIVRYRYDSLFVGAPDRSHRPPLSCPLALEELVRVEYNGRTSWPTGEWSYEHTVFNVVLTGRPTLDMFLAPPARAVTDLADLW